MKILSKKQKIFGGVVVVLVLLLGLWVILSKKNNLDTIEAIETFSSVSANIHFNYPSRLFLQIAETPVGVVLSHMVPFQERLCGDERGFENSIKVDGGFFDELALEVQIDERNINDLYPNLKEDITRDDGSFMQINIGGKNGYYAVRAVEMCGTIDHYFPLSSGTLIVKQDAEAIAVRNLGRLKEVAGSFTDEEYQIIFDMIVQTAKPVKDY